MSENTSTDHFTDLDGVEMLIIHFSDGRPNKTVYTRALAESYWFGPMPVSEVTYPNGMLVNFNI